MVALKKGFLIFFALLFVVSVYVYGTTNRFSSEAYLENLSLSIADIPDIQGLVDIWSDGGGVGSLGGGSGHAGGRSTDEEQTLLEVVNEFFADIGRFFRNIWSSILYIVDIIKGVFELLPAFLPWNENAIVPTD